MQGSNYACIDLINSMLLLSCKILILCSCNGFVINLSQSFYYYNMENPLLLQGKSPRCSFLPKISFNMAEQVINLGGQFEGWVSKTMEDEEKNR